ncbi:hypothetical protein EVAR_54315_1 [Eumeta japonica]|uniref:Uncharacterized protein n=1 Tax=Eumeta variegata TaxID=151549 RepID=A0A4C1Z3T4_EUMVA|nr:hypothetical protein EVAR_54315_1 [Eumeta japonica]
MAKSSSASGLLDKLKGKARSKSTIEPSVTGPAASTSAIHNRLVIFYSDLVLNPNTPVVSREITLIELDPNPDLGSEPDSDTK